MVRQEQQLPPICSLRDIENLVFTRVAAEVAELERKGQTLTDEDLSRLWQKQVRKVQEQMQERAEKKREQLRSLFNKGDKEKSLTS